MGACYRKPARAKDKGAGVIDIPELHFLPVDSAGETTTEIAERLGVSINTAQRRMKRALKAGRVRVVKKQIERIGGDMVPVPAYVMAEI